jgi:hypothetical protein
LTRSVFGIWEADGANDFGDLFLSEPSFNMGWDTLNGSTFFKSKLAETSLSPMGEPPFVDFEQPENKKLNKSNSAKKCRFTFSPRSNYNVASFIVKRESHYHVNG